MATAKKSATEVKLTPAQLKKENESLKEELRVLKEESCHCYLCGKVKKKEKFYVSTDPMVKSGKTPICMDCARKIALRVDKNGEEHEPTKESVQLALRYLNTASAQLTSPLTLMCVDMQIAVPKISGRSHIA